MSDYARIKGSAAPVTPARFVAPSAPRPLSEAERERVAENRAFVLEHLPELVPIIGELHQSGIVDGWRCVQNCRMLDHDE